MSALTFHLSLKRLGWDFSEAPCRALLWAGRLGSGSSWKEHDPFIDGAQEMATPVQCSKDDIIDTDDPSEHWKGRQQRAGFRVGKRREGGQNTWTQHLEEMATS